MNKLSIKDMLSGKKSRYALVMGVAKRARQIADKIEESGEIVEDKPVNLAIKDFKEDKYEIIEPNTKD